MLVGSHSLVITTRPITPEHDAYILLDVNGALTQYALSKDAPIAFASIGTIKYCTGWYDIATHTNHSCATRQQIEPAYDACFACRKKTDFNPAFYNTTSVSDKQAAYNAQPHSVYIAYFGNGLVKAGIMSDSRGRERLYEQGALFYAVVASYPDANEAHALEQRLIRDGLKNSVSKKQKALVYAAVISSDVEIRAFRAVLATLGYQHADVLSNLDWFFYGEYPRQPIVSFMNNQASGRIAGVIGRYLVLENNDRYYGLWLSDLSGYEVTLTTSITPIDRTLQQVSLFGS